MKTRNRKTYSRIDSITFWFFVIATVVLVVMNAGCVDARRNYSYTVTTAPDGTVTKTVNVDILNSDVKVGQLEAIGADGTTIRLNDLDAQERASVIIEKQADVLGKAIDKLSPPGVTP